MCLYVCACKWVFIFTCVQVRLNASLCLSWYYMLYALSTSPRLRPRLDVIIQSTNEGQHTDKVFSACVSSKQWVQGDSYSWLLSYHCQALFDPLLSCCLSTSSSSRRVARKDCLVPLSASNRHQTACILYTYIGDTPVSLALYSCRL